ncbi:MAG: transposase [Hyphomicrobiales bacterium]|nr:transposase [Hyphomicrobiales bacterium]
MARKRYSDEDCLKILRQVELDLAAGADVAKACRTAGISDATFYTWRKKFGGMAKPQLTELKALEKENQRLKKIVAALARTTADGAIEVIGFVTDEGVTNAVLAAYGKQVTIKGEADDRIAEADAKAEALAAAIAA